MRDQSPRRRTNACGSWREPRAAQLALRAREVDLGNPRLLAPRSELVTEPAATISTDVRAHLVDEAPVVAGEVLAVRTLDIHGDGKRRIVLFARNVEVADAVRDELAADLVAVVDDDARACE